ncbi:hypothetical protein [Segetibacter koreensis]|uniref:hypothetical protein n=1 Tax=Segetibacter koreensis TaxID=398037 RepID=UPI00037098DE|nr:hypothetical protein [Segetibacter koreensis]
MATEQERALQEKSENIIDGAKSPLGGLQNKATEQTNEAGNNEQNLPVEQADDEVTNNDGSIVETLDTAFHNEPGVIKDHSIAGSNRADYYEAQSQGKSDAEEEMDFIRKQQAE